MTKPITILCDPGDLTKAQMLQRKMLEKGFTPSLSHNLGQPICPTIVIWAAGSNAAAQAFKNQH